MAASDVPKQTDAVAAVDAGLSGYDLTIPSMIRFGWGSVGRLAEVVSGLGKQAWVVSGRDGFRASGGEAAVASAFRQASIPWEPFASVGSEPTSADVAVVLRDVVRRDPGDAVIVAVGGGSTIDLAKAVAALATNVGHRAEDADVSAWEQHVVDHLEGVGRGLPIVRTSLPVVAVPTTAGTGAEVTCNAVISCPRRRFKKSLRSPLMVPRAAIVDPALTRSCPVSITVTSGLDAITQLIEAYVSRFARPIPQALVREALPRAIDALPKAVRASVAFHAGQAASDEARPAREAMSHAALVSGIALANSGLGMAHGVAAALGIACGIPHGAACAVMLPASIRFNLEMRQREYAELEQAMAAAGGGGTAGDATAFLSRIENLCDEVAAPRRLSDLGVDPGMVDWLASNSGGNSMRGNPVDVTPERLRSVLRAML